MSAAAKLGVAQRAMYGIGGLALFLIAWQVIGINGWGGLAWPPLTDVLALLADPLRRPPFTRALSATLTSMLFGYLVGALLGLGGAIGSHLMPPLRRGTDRLAAVVNSIPSIAL